MDLAERRRADRKLSKRRQEARQDYERHAEEEARADARYREKLAVEFAKARGDGAAANEAEIYAKSEASQPKLERDLAHAKARAALLKIEEVERDSVTVRDIHSTSEKIDGIAA